MRRPSARELERELENLEEVTDVPPLKDLWIRSIKRHEGLVEDPLPEDEFEELWEESYRQHHGEPE